MKIRYFGTAAYEGVPALFCNCETCLKARKNGGKDLRTRSQALVNDDLLIEFNPDTVAHYQKYLFDWAKIGYCLITHSHSDHFYPADLEMLVHPGYTHDVSPVAFYAGKSYGGIEVTNVTVGNAKNENNVLPDRKTWEIEGEDCNILRVTLNEPLCENESVSVKFRLRQRCRLSITASA